MFWGIESIFLDLKTISPYKIYPQIYIPTTCCTIHSFIEEYNENNDTLFTQYKNVTGIIDIIVKLNYLVKGSNNSSRTVQIYLSVLQFREMSLLRDGIATQICHTLLEIINFKLVICNSLMKLYLTCDKIKMCFI